VAVSNELEFQRVLCQSLVAQGGYAQKIASRFQVGVPDLLMAHKDFEPTLVECKWLGEKKKFDFSIVPELTRPQYNHLQGMAAIRGKGSAAVAVGWVFNRTHHFILLAPGQASHSTYGSAWVRVAGHYDVRAAILEYRQKQEKIYV
jgi:hypothetical protein